MTKQEIFDYIAGQAEFINKVSDDVWDNPETAFEEFVSADVLCRALEEAGFRVERNVADIKTAFSGTYGSGRPVIGFLGEFDALSGLSQQAGSTEKIPLAEGGNGHGCGHNLLGAGCLAAAIGMKKYLEETGKEGTVIFYGCPGEEGGSGKTFMAREGAFDCLDAAIAWHPGVGFGSAGVGLLANCQVYFRFKGISSHAAAAPEKGRSALDAAELMNIGVQFLREHVPSTVRMHYAITDTGGFSPNVVQPTAEVLYVLRAPDNVILADVYERVRRIAAGAAMMTDTKVEIDFVKACSNRVPNDTLGYVAVDNLRLLKPLAFTEEELAFYSELSRGIPGGNPDAPVNTVIPDYLKTDRVLGASSDVGDVSWIVPTALLETPTWPIACAAHSWQAVACGKSGIAHKSMIAAGQAMAGIAIDILDDPELLARANEEQKKRLNGEKYACPIPQGVRPRSISGRKA